MNIWQNISSNVQLHKSFENFAASDFLIKDFLISYQNDETAHRYSYYIHNSGPTYESSNRPLEHEHFYIHEIDNLNKKMHASGSLIYY